MYDEARHWRLVNRMARVFGIAAVLAGVAFAGAAFQHIMQPDPAAHVPSASGSAATDAIAVSVFTLVVGILFLLVKPYRPDLRKDKNPEDASKVQRFSWWTGEPKKARSTSRQ